MPASKANSAKVLGIKSNLFILDSVVITNAFITTQIKVISFTQGQHKPHF